MYMYQVWNKIQQLWPTPGAPLPISPPQNFSHRLQHVWKLWSIFFPFNGCLGSRGTFGFVFVWVLALSFTHSVWVNFFVNFRLFSESFFSLSASNSPSPYFQFVQEYGISIGNRTEWSTIQSDWASNLVAFATSFSSVL